MTPREPRSGAGRRPLPGREPRRESRRDIGADPDRPRQLRPAAPYGPERLHIDWTACDGRGLCTELLPELLDRDEWGFPVSRDGLRDPVVPPHLHPHAERAVTSCPMLALRLVGGPA